MAFMAILVGLAEAVAGRGAQSITTKQVDQGSSRLAASHRSLSLLLDLVSSACKIG
jgi:hypothetical protein